MEFILDTHTFLWFCNGSEKLSKTARSIIENPENLLYISIASIWEIAIKSSLGKLEISGGYKTVEKDIEDNKVSIIPIGFADTLTQNSLEFHHRDPFDRMIISQSLNKGLDIISIDSIFDNYFKNESCKRIWE